MQPDQSRPIANRMRTALIQIDAAMRLHCDGRTPEALALYRLHVVRFESAYRVAVRASGGLRGDRVVAAIGRGFADHWRQTQAFLARRHGPTWRLLQVHAETLAPATARLQGLCEALGAR
jgi:hypothetical protein